MSFATAFWLRRRASAETAPAVPPPVPFTRLGPGPYDPVAREAAVEITAARAPVDLPAPAWALELIADLRKQLAGERETAADKAFTALTAAMPKTDAGRIHELAAVRADRDRVEAVNDRLCAELAELRAKLAAP